MATQVLRLVLGMATGVVLARALEPEGRGVYAVITTTGMTAIIIGHLSVPYSQIAFWKEGLLNRVLAANGLLLGLLSGSVAMIGALALSPIILPGAPALVTAAVTVVPLGVVISNLRGILLLQGQVNLVNRSNLTSAAIQCVGVALLAGVGHVHIAAVVALWWVFTAAPLFLYVRALRPRLAHADRGLALRQLGLSARYHGGPIAVHLLITCDVLLLNAMVSPSETGLYTVAASVLALAYVPADAITMVVLPRQAGDDPAGSKSATARALWVTLLSSSACVGLLAAASPILVPFVYGDSYAKSVTSLLLLAPGVVALSMVRLTEQYLVRLRRPLAMAGICTGALIFNVALNLYLIPRWGAPGAAVSSTLSYGLLALTEFVWFRRTRGTS
ncbi:polysaccharide biosynthesis C-terminal domain-containing protein [Nonomuraea sp. NPDC050786]|uniref:polysaccharide biosynthesis C-terminal domain-containing protein n=1 Tax=Nonomuraea sp. NPDC050786 TaxID=3154840 RepID=UPI0033D152CC